jgi:hypothetical protein
VPRKPLVAPWVSVAAFILVFFAVVAGMPYIAFRKRYLTRTIAISRRVHLIREQTARGAYAEEGKEAE